MLWQGDAVRREWELDDLIAAWTVVEADGPLLSGRYGATKLGFALMLKFFEIEGRFPRHAGEVPPAAVEYVARQVGVDAAEFARYSFSGRQVKNPPGRHPRGAGVPRVHGGR